MRCCPTCKRPLPGERLITEQHGFSLRDRVQYLRFGQWVYGTICRFTPARVGVALDRNPSALHWVKPTSLRKAWTV